MNSLAADRVEVVNFGCRLNIAEGEAVRVAANAADDGDAIVFNSCAVTDEAVRQVRQAVRRRLRERPGSAVFVTGCASELEGEVFAAMGARVVPNDAKGLAASYRPAKRADVQSGEAGTNPPPGSDAAKPRPAYAPSLSGADHARAFLGVQTGC